MDKLVSLTFCFVSIDYPRNPAGARPEPGSRSGHFCACALSTDAEPGPGIPMVPIPFSERVRRQHRRHKHTVYIDLGLELYIEIDRGAKGTAPRWPLCRNRLSVTQEAPASPNWGFVHMAWARAFIGPQIHLPQQSKIRLYLSKVSYS